MKVWHAGEAVRVTLDGKTVCGTVILASANGKSLMLGIEDILGGYVDMVPLMWDDDDDTFVDLGGLRPMTVDEVTGSVDSAVAFKLDENHVPVPCTLLEASNLLEQAKLCRVAFDGNVQPGIDVSTVFLVFTSCRSYESGLPSLFETMILRDGLCSPADGQWRYRSWDDALAGHENVVLTVKSGVSAPWGKK